MSRRAGNVPLGGPAYLTPAPSTAPPPNEGAFGRFLRTEIFSPEKLPGNIAVAVSVTMFTAGITAVRLWGDLMVPP
ncbi:hypothetical protein DL96DRAFT_1586290 [Flagelloscypha sp. PMI_526]|nr:hypothetical protein DL96DRAFT_1616330 [Flagelloscypha sp. PMI_526]KAH8831037.1 hypothetical protein DL96DRAFT_1586290 [Flagelloscypha sp. PMI_526]